VCPRLEPLSDFRYDAAMRAKNGEVSKATDLQQTPYPRVIHRGYCIKVKKAEWKGQGFGFASSVEAFISHNQATFSHGTNLH
jgi:hypothetical protein